MTRITAAHCHGLSRQLPLYLTSVRAPARTCVLKGNCRGSARQCATVTYLIRYFQQMACHKARGNSRKGRLAHDNAEGVRLGGR